MLLFLLHNSTVINESEIFRVNRRDWSTELLYCLRDARINVDGLQQISAASESLSCSEVIALRAPIAEARFLISK